MDTFASFSLTHLVAVFVSVTGWILVSRWMRTSRDTEYETRDRRRLIVWIAGPCLAGTAYWMWEHGAEPSFALPLHLCDLAWMIGCVSLLVRNPLPRDLIYYWGFGLSAQAFVTPTLQEGPADYHFWLFWFVHWSIVLVAIVNVAALGYRPSWRGLKHTVIATLMLFAVVTPLNLALGSNYWFTGQTQPDNPTVIDGLGPYPLRLVWMVLLVFCLFVAMTWPWERQRARTTESASELATD
ncbi:MAG: TIGR02206 family membrane protein [Planctomycetes bacterium]|nr:TIGR02206 family membrane protein [Planctomycetota bacterium]